MRTYTYIYTALLPPNKKSLCPMTTAKEMKQSMRRINSTDTINMCA